MFSISASLWRMGKALMPRSGSTQEILVLLQEHDEHASADIHGSGDPTAIPITITKPQHKHRHDPEPVRGEDAAPLAGPQALIFGCQLQQ